MPEPMPCLYLCLQNPLPFASVGLKYCGINMGQPARYNVLFSVRHDGGPAATAMRQVVLEATCDSGEVSRHG